MTRARVGAVLLVLAFLVTALVASACGSSAADEATDATDTTTGGHAGFSPGAGLLDDDPAHLAADLDAMRATGGRWVRVDVDWSGIEPTPGAFDTAALDRVITAARARGLRVLGVVDYTPAWARPAGTDDHHPPDDPAAMARFATAVAGHWRGQVDAWEVWNEPNVASFWSPGADPDAYARLLRAVAPALHAADPGVPVLSGGLAPASDGDDGGGDRDPVAFLDALYRDGAEQLTDGVAVHPYTYPDAPGEPSLPPTLFARLGDLHALMALRGQADHDLWLTEFGAPTGTGERAVDPVRQAAIISAGIERARRTPWVALVLVYALRDAGTDPSDQEQNFGIESAGGTPKPALRAVRDEFSLPWQP